ncbi:MAG: hypothetical protein QXP57_07120 [Nitrososphaerota archaeon]
MGTDRSRSFPHASTTIQLADFSITPLCGLMELLSFLTQWGHISWRMNRHDPLIAFMNKLVDKRFHKHFKDPNRCLEAIYLDTLLHQYLEIIFGLSRDEIERRTARYVGKAMETCMRSMLKNIFKS